VAEWLLTRGDVPSAHAYVYCFPYAGGNPRVYLEWGPHLAGDAEVVAVCPPGRGPRAMEPHPPIEAVFDGAAAAIADAARDGRPVYLFGHSLGGLMAYEVARRLRGLPALRHLVVSGIAAPSLLPSRRVCELAALEGRAFAEALRFFGGLPPEVFADEGVLELLLPGLQAEFRTAVGYRYRPAPALDLPATLIAGREDPHVGPDQLRPWRDEFRFPPEQRWADGGHFYFAGRPEAVTDLLRGLVTADQHVELI
jgi:surfactin synthase thioesterase subunit